MTETWAIVERWLHPSGRRQSIHTRRAYRRHVVGFIQGANKPLGAIRLDDLQGWWDELQMQGSPASHRQAVAAVKSLLTFAQHTGAIRYNVGVAIEVKRAPDELAKRIMSEDEVISLIGAARRKPRDYALVQLLYRTGLRVSELVGLRWEDAVPVRDDGAVLVVLGKGNRVRRVRVNPDTWSLVLRLRGTRHSSRTWIFAGRPKEAGADAPLSARRIEYIVAELGQKAGFARRITPHWLRHACASHALDRKASIALVREQLGHQSLDTTSRYVHARPADSLDEYLPEIDR